MTWMAKKQFETECGVSWPCMERCIYDYDASACPVGWAHLGDDLCEASVGYDGHCLSRVRMWGNGFKRDFAARCRVRWPCAKTCAEDYGSDCPEGWSAVDGVCAAQHIGYTGPCAPFADLRGLTLAQKQRWADSCAVNFPCAGPLNTPCGDIADSESLCPVGWLRVGSDHTYCYGSTYDGPCRPLISLEKLQQIGLELFSNRCHVELPCSIQR